MKPKTGVNKIPAPSVKGTHTQIFKGQRQINCLGGSSVLARGGSGDLLSGIMGVFLQKILFREDAACLAVLWHGRAAEVLARQYGQEAIRTTEILNYLSFAIRNDF